MVAGQARLLVDNYPGELFSFWKVFTEYLIHSQVLSANFVRRLPVTEG